MNIKNIFPLTVSLLILLLTIGCTSDKPQESINVSPRIISSGAVHISDFEPFVFRPQFIDPDGPDTIISYNRYPAWLKVEDDSIFGTVPKGEGVFSFMVIVSDGIQADSLVLREALPPSLIVYGDTRTGHTVHQQIVDLIRTNEPDAVFHVGDLVNNGNSQDDWDIFNDITEEMRMETEFYPSLGNHENQSQIYFDLFDLPNNEQWYSVEKNGIHFIILNSCVAIDSLSEQYLWLENDLISIHDSIKYIAAVFHHPPYSTGPHTEDEKGLRKKIVPLFEQYGVDIVFTGHDHDYERSFCGGIYYIVTGGGGAPLRDQARTHPCSELFFEKVPLLPDINDAQPDDNLGFR